MPPDREQRETAVRRSLRRNGRPSILTPVQSVTGGLGDDSVSDRYGRGTFETLIVEVRGASRPLEQFTAALTAIGADGRMIQVRPVELRDRGGNAYTLENQLWEVWGIVGSLEPLKQAKCVVRWQYPMNARVGVRAAGGAPAR